MFLVLKNLLVKILFTKIKLVLVASNSKQQNFNTTNILKPLLYRDFLCQHCLSILIKFHVQAQLFQTFQLILAVHIAICLQTSRLFICDTYGNWHGYKFHPTDKWSSFSNQNGNMADENGRNIMTGNYWHYR